MATAKKAAAKKAAAKKPTYADYGFVKGFLTAHPDVKAKVDAAIKGRWEPSRLQAAIKTTNWWKKSSDASRQWDILIAENPSEASKRKAAVYARIKRMESQLGVALTAAERDRITRTAARNQWDDQAVQAWIGSKYDAPAAGKSLRGAAATTVDELRATARAYGQPLSDETAEAYTRSILSGDRDVKTYQDQFRESAKRLYPSVAKDLEAGATISDLLNPYMEQAAKDLGVNPATMQTNDQKWTRALTGGSGGAMTLDEWQHTLRTASDYGWDKTPTAMNQATKFVANLRQTFGSL